MTVHIGWWIIPLILSVAAWVWAIRPVPGDTFGLQALFQTAGAVIATLLAWLIYFIFVAVWS